MEDVFDLAQGKKEEEEAKETYVLNYFF